MLKVLIVDDEIQICRLIRKFLEDEGLGVEIIGEAYSGRTALNLIREKTPEIVITDIRMPGIDGLELVRHVQDMKLQTTFILISGHKEFEYAYSAINYGVEYYMLKPINKTELQRNIRLIQQKKNETLNYREIVTRTTKKAKKIFVQELITNYKNISQMTLVELKSIYSLELNRTYYIPGILKLDYKYDLEENQKKTFIYQLEAILQEIELSGELELENIRLGNQIAILFGYNNEEIFYQTADKFIMEVCNRYYEFASITLGLGDPVNDIRQIQFSNAKESILSRLVYGCNKIIKYGPPKAFMPPKDFSDITLQIKRSLEILNETEVKKVLCPLKDYILSQQDAPCCQYNSVIHIIKKLLPTINTISQDEDKPLLYGELESELYDCNTRLKLYTTFESVIVQSIRDAKKLQEAKEHKYVRMAKEYVSEHYQENITLEDIARVTFINATYFSILFKQKEGINFSDYLTQYRIRIAKELLKDSSLSIGEVGVKTGYKNAKYFSKVFMKLVGIKPSEYRKLFI